MRKDREFSSLIETTEITRDITMSESSRLLRTAIFIGKFQWAIQNGVKVLEIEDLNRAGILRVKQTMQDPSQIPIPNGIEIKNFETKELLKLVPQNVQDRCRTGTLRHHWSELQARETIFRHFINMDFAKCGFNMLNGGFTSPEGRTCDMINNLIRQNLPDRNPKIESFNLGKVVTRHDIPSTLGPFEFAPNCEIQYPIIIIEALGQLVKDHTMLFSRFVAENTEGNDHAYNYCPIVNGCISEPFFQVDIAGLSQEFLVNGKIASSKDLIETLKGRIFEFEPSIAMYGLIETFGSAGTLGTKFREHLDVIRKANNMPIVLLAPTVEKLEAMKEEEFGKTDGQLLTAEEVKTISGFDDLWGPGEFKKHFSENNGQCKCLLYVRPSDPIFKLIDPKRNVINPILDDLKMRKIIRNSAITLNIDNPDWSINDLRRIKDSKAALPLMNMGFEVNSIDEIVSDQNFLTDKFSQFMISNHKNALSQFRAKPMRGVYGGYGQKTIKPLNNSDINWLKTSIELRGPYIIQPEIEPLILKDDNTGKLFAVMDRAFFSTVNGSCEFIGGIRILIPTDSNEANRRRLHGTDKMISVPITQQ